MNDVMTKTETVEETEETEDTEDTEEDEADYQAFEDRIDQCYDLLETWTCGDEVEVIDSDEGESGRSENEPERIDEGAAFGTFATFLARIARELDVSKDEFLELLAELWEEHAPPPELTEAETANLS